MDLDATTVAYIGIFVGVLLRTLLPYVKKLKKAEDKNEEFKFDFKYAGTAIFALVISFVVSTLIFPTFTIPEIALPYVFAQAFAFGWTANDIINEIIS